MPLIRQIWLLVLGSLLLAFVASMGVTFVSTRDTLQTQLQLKNSDNATSLALALSQQRGEQSLMELLLSAQFDTGYYQEVRLVAADGRTLFTREAVLTPVHAPAWFAALLPIESVPGVAQVSDGWRALGSVQVVSHTAYAHDELWRGGQRAAASLGVVGIVAALLAWFVVGRIRRPLDATVEQAQSLVNGQFVTVPEPRAPELRRVTRAMNAMVSRLKLIFEAQAAQVESLRQQAHTDATTGLSNRKHFMAQLEASMHREDGAAAGGLVLVRLLDLAGVNRELGHAATDRVIATVAQAMTTYAQRAPGCMTGRLNGADFALALPVGGLALETGSAIAQALRAGLPAFGGGVAVAVSVVETRREHELGQCLAEADAALARAESHGPFSVEQGTLGDPAATAPAPRGEAVWRQQLIDALEHSRISLVDFPLIDAAGRLVVLEAPLRVQFEAGGGFAPAALWMPLALRSHLTAQIDERAVRLALQAIRADGRARCINVSTASLADGAFVARLRGLLGQERDAARQLWLDVPEGAAVDRFEQVQELARQLRPLGVRTGIEHAGERLARITRLLDAGLDYVKLDASMVGGVAGDGSRVNHLRGVIAMVHGLSMQVFAEGVTVAADAACLLGLGIDGVTGPWASAQPRA